jgi:hypothetical protein
MKGQFVVEENNQEKRISFYKYILKKYKLDNYVNNIQSKYPLVIDFDENIIYTLESITCCALAEQNKQIISISEFKKKERK